MGAKTSLQEDHLSDEQKTGGEYENPAKKSVKINLIRDQPNVESDLKTPRGHVCDVVKSRWLNIFLP
jgi:hypothetical protein